MTGFAALLLIAAACWFVRAAFIVFVPADRLPDGITAALGQVAPAVLAALVSVGLVDVVTAGTTQTGLGALGCVAAIATVARVRPSLTVSAALGLAAVVLVDLVAAS